jgi:hypothetical protein
MAKSSSCLLRVRYFPERPVVGAIFQTRDLVVLNQILVSAGILDSLRIVTDTYKSSIVPQCYTHGIWLEFRQEVKANDKTQ